MQRGLDLVLGDEEQSPNEVIQNMRENNSLTRYVQARRERRACLICSTQLRSSLQRD